MADAVIGALRVVLGADTAAFEKGLKGASSSLSGFSKTTALGVAGIITAITGAAAAFAVGIQRTINSADELNKASQKFGIPVEELSKLKYAADLADVSFESLSTGFGKLSKNMAAAVQDSAGPIAQAFNAIGVSVADTTGHLKSSDEVFAAVAEKFSNMQDGAGKTALAIQIFGKAGADLIPLLNAGKDGLASLTAEAEALGIVMDSKTAASCETFNDALTTLSQVWEGFKTQVVVGIAGPLADFAKAMKDSAVQAGGLKTAGQAFGEWLAATIPLIINAVAAMQGLGAAAGAMAKTLALAANGRWSDAMTAFAAGNDKVTAIGASWQVVLDNMQQAATFPVAPYISAVDAAGKATAPLVTSQKELAAAAAESKAGIAAYHKELAEGQRVYEDTRTSQQTLGDQLDKLKKLYADGAISAQTYAAAAKQASADALQAQLSTTNQWLSTASVIGGALEGIFGKTKAVAIAQAIINTLQGITQALTLPFPLNWVQAAAVTASGFAQVAKIKSTKPAKFAEGGSFKVGGSGGIDSKLVSMKLTPGEMVDIRKPGNDNRKAASIALPRGFTPKDLYTGQNMIDLADALGAYVDDGGKFRKRSWA